MRPLTARQAGRCEDACGPRCRCGGALHGANRAGREGVSREWLEALPEDDPHHVPIRKS